jgi:hypothetical protein
MNPHNLVTALAAAATGTSGSILKNASASRLFHWGITVPTAAGYASGSPFLHTDGSTGDMFLVNKGSETSTNFQPITDLLDNEYLRFGTGDDITAHFDATNLLWTGASANIGSIRVTNVMMQIGAFATSAATTSAVPFTAAQDIWTDGQLSTMEVHGSSATNLTSTYSAKCGRFRHVCNIGTHGDLGHETYGVMGQLVVRETTLKHLHSGVIGTLEGHTSGVVSNSAYAYGVSAVMARVGGAAYITAIKPVCGFLAFWNGAALVSGVSIAHGTTYLTTPWTYGFANSVGSVVADIKLQAEDAASLPCCIFSGAAANDGAIVSQVGSDTLWADGSLYISCVDGAGSLWMKVNDVWTVNSLT